jgi:hypothetical protein
MLALKCDRGIGADVIVLTESITNVSGINRNQELKVYPTSVTSQPFTDFFFVLWKKKGDNNLFHCVQ